MATTKHTIHVELERKGEEELIDGGHVTIEGKDYDGFDDNEALTSVLPGGDAPITLDLSMEGFVRWRNIIMPAGEFKSLRATVVSKSRPSQR